MLNSSKCTLFKREAAKDIPGSQARLDDLNRHLATHRSALARGIHHAKSALAYHVQQRVRATAHCAGTKRGVDLGSQLTECVVDAS